MSKDPAVLFYTKDWLEGTVDMFPEEKGVYIDLLCFQHQKGFLPKNERRLAKITGISEEQFTTIWQEIKQKFITIDTLDTSLSEPLSVWKTAMCADGFADALVNLRMLLETITRKKMTSTKSIQAYVANWFRYDTVGKFLKKSTKEKILKMVDYEKLRTENSGKKDIYNYLDTLTKRVAKQSHIGNGNGDVNASVITINEINSGANEIENATHIENQKMFDQNFQQQLFEFFSMTGKTQIQMVLKKLSEIAKMNLQDEFVVQTNAYMQFKAISSEKKHSWGSFQNAWQQTDWVHKLSQLSEKESATKTTFAINR